jgi:hypothetical protein
MTSMRIAGAWAAGVALCLPLGCAIRGDVDAAVSSASAVVVGPPLVANADAPIPSNGGLLISGPVSDPPRVSVTRSDDPGAGPFAGSVHSLFHYRVWVGEAPLPLGAYSVTIDGTPFGSGSAAIQIAAPRTLARPAIESEAALVVTREVPIIDCCWTLTDRVPPLLSCFTVQREDQASLSVTLSSGEPASVLSQLLFRVTAVGAEAANPLRLAELYSLLVFPAQADEYCYQVEAFEITTGESYLFDGRELCVPHGNEAALETRSVPVGESQLHRAICPAPPAEQRVAWCSFNLAACEGEEEGTAACSLAGHVCRGEPRPAGMVYDPSGDSSTDYAGAGGAGGMNAGGASGMDSGGTSGGMSASGGASGTTGEPSGDAGDAPSEPRERASNCSCGVVLRTRSAEPGMRVGALGALAVLAARRGRRRVAGPSA